MKILTYRITVRSTQRDIYEIDASSMKEAEEEFESGLYDPVDNDSETLNITYEVLHRNRRPTKVR